MSITDDELAEWQRACDAATAGPLRAVRHPSSFGTDEAYDTALINKFFP